MKKINNKLKKDVDIFLSQYFKRIAGAVALAVFLAGAAFAYKHAYFDRMKTMAVEEAAIRAVLDVRQVELTKAKDDSANLKAIADKDLEKIEKMIADEGNDEDLYEYFSRLIAKNGLLLTSIAIAKEEAVADQAAASPDKPADLGVYNITLNIIGTNYKGFLNLLAFLENNLQLLDIQSVNYTGQSVVLSLNTYFLKAAHNKPSKKPGSLSIFQNPRFKKMTEMEAASAPVLKPGNKVPFGEGGAKKEKE